MTIQVYDYRKDIANLVVHPEIRGRFLRMEPGPAARMHSHDLGGEIFLVLEGKCEFLVEEEHVVCGPGQLIYVEPKTLHTLHAVGDEPCIVYLSVTPHVEPTHTRYDEDFNRLPPQYGTWRGTERSDADADTAELARRYVEAAERLAALSEANQRVAKDQLTKLDSPDAEASDRKDRVDELWASLRPLLVHVRELEAKWNVLAPSVTPEQ